jgi:integrase/recombinase XerD
MEQDRTLYKKELFPKRVNGFLNYLSSMRGMSDNTLIAYSTDLSIFFKYLKMDRNLVSDNIEFDSIDIADIDDSFISSITEDDLIAFIAWSMNERNNNDKTRARKTACLKSFFRYLYKHSKIIQINPAVDLETPKIGKRNPIFLSLEESIKLLESINSRNTIRDHCIVTLFLNCGIRLSELCRINLIDIKDDTLSVIGKGNKQRSIPLNDACVSAISTYLLLRKEILKKCPKDKVSKDASKALFLSERKNRINKRTVQELVEKYIKEAGLDGRKYSVHKLRHTAATLSYRNGADILSVQQLLGHESVSTTQIYVHIVDDQLRKAVNVNPLGRLK